MVLWYIIAGEGWCTGEADVHELFSNVFSQSAETREFPSSMKLAPDALTPLAFKNSRTASVGTSAACDAGAAFEPPATTVGFSSAMPANLPSLSSAAAPEKPTVGAGQSAKSLLPDGAIDALTPLAAVPPPWLCGSAMPVSSTADFVPPSVRFSGFNPRAP